MQSLIKVDVLFDQHSFKLSKRSVCFVNSLKGGDSHLFDEKFYVEVGSFLSIRLYSLDDRVCEADASGSGSECIIYSECHFYDLL